MTTQTPKKVPSWALAKELQKPVEEVIALGERVTRPEERSRAHAKLTWYLPDAAERIRQAIAAPLTVAKRFNAYGLHEARNPRWMFCKIEGLDGKHPVIIPRKLQGRLLQKVFEVEAIEDVNGTTYRHVLLATGARV